MVPRLGLGIDPTTIECKWPDHKENKLPTVAENGDITQEPTVRGMGR
jgi:hypothetical protein